MPLSKDRMREYQRERRARVYKVDSKPVNHEVDKNPVNQCKPRLGYSPVNAYLDLGRVPFDDDASYKAWIERSVQDAVKQGLIH